MVATLLLAGYAFFLDKNIKAFESELKANTATINRHTKLIEKADDLWAKSDDLLKQSEDIASGIIQHYEQYQHDKQVRSREYQKIQKLLKEHHGKLEILKNTIKELHQSG